MRLMRRITAIALIATAFSGVISGQAEAAGNGGCRMSEGFRHRIVELQQLLGVEPDGDLGPRTCGEVLKLHDVLIESGTIPASQRGLIGRTTFRVLQNPDESTVEAPKPATKPVSTRCRPKDN
jgi:hypothetical protein